MSAAAMAPPAILYVAVSVISFMHTAGSDCSNLWGNAVCDAAPNMCLLERDHRCNCEQTCNAAPFCLEPLDNDTACDCPFQAPFCIHPMMRTTCSSTCDRRDTVVCEDLGPAIPGAVKLFNDKTPSYAAPLYMDFVTYTCDAGFTKTSGTAEPMKRVCLMNGSWLEHPDHQQPLVCTRVSCGVVPDVSLATPSRQSGVFEDEVTYTCSPGYIPNGPSSPGTHVCDAQGNWNRTEPDPTCIARPCELLPTVANAAPTPTPGVYASTVTYGCIAGFSQTGGGSGLRTCVEDGTWYQNVTDPLCTGLPCPPLPIIANAVPSSNSGVYRDIVTYSCSEGYSQSGGSTGERTCTVAQTWHQSEANPVCVGVPCPVLPTVANASPSSPSGVYPDIVTYTCSEGYSQSGGSTGERRCTTIQTWNQVEADPICSGISCGPPTAYPGAVPSATIGYFGDVITYTCSPDHIPIRGDNASFQCTSNGSWALTSSYEPLCLGLTVKFINSESEQQAAAPNSLISETARSSLHCATYCAKSIYCRGFSFYKQSGVCDLNMASTFPVITAMKRLYQ